MEKEQLKKWVYRLQKYIKDVETSQGQQKESAIQSLLGYLSSLEIIFK